MAERLDRSQLMDRAAKATGLSDFGDIPFTEALDVLVYALERDAKLDSARRAQAAGMIEAALVKRLKLADDRKRHPEIAAEEIATPIFIVGLPRTGSTNLHGLMAQCEGVRAARYWEMLVPSPPPEAATYDSDPRIAQVQAVHVAGSSEDLKKRHPMDARRPEECIFLYDHSFMNWALMALFHIPSYVDWLLLADHRPAYETHKQMLQHLQWRNPGQWVLKLPKHIFALDALAEVYPDARIIWTHRDPTKVLPSVASLIGVLQAATPGYDPKVLGRSWTAFEELGLRRGLDVRDRVFSPDAVYDMHYRDVMADPVAAIGGALDHFGMTLSEESKRRILAFQADNAQDKHGVHAYTAAEYGLTEDRLRAVFGDYVDRFGVS
jgi:hypothetical protein